MTAAIYARCSSEESAVKGLSIADQVERCRARAEELKLEVVEVFRDEGFSAGVGARERRPAFDQMITDARARHFKNIICLDTSRFSRDPIESETLERILEKRGVKLIFIHIPESGPYTEIIRAFFRVMDRFHSVTSKVKSHQGQERTVRQGYRAGGPAPYGYRLKRHTLGVSVPMDRRTRALRSSWTIGRQVMRRGRRRQRRSASTLSDVLRERVGSRSPGISTTAGSRP